MLTIILLNLQYDLMEACEEGDLETVIRLLEEGADKHFRDGVSYRKQYDISSQNDNI